MKLPLPEIVGLCPLLQVFDMRRSLLFYCDTLGFEVVQQSPAGANPDWVWLRQGAAELMLNTMFELEERPPQMDSGRVSAHHDTALYMNTSDVGGAYAFLLSRGVPADVPVTRCYGMRQTYFHDPDGYMICFQCPVR